ncbi:MAG: Asp-tRNA(Asn)/Glu-tRNA(Gln) amidotransferase subunit GatC [Planctomycetota bacterium]
MDGIIDEVLVDHLAALARLVLSPEEKRVLVGQLERILAFVAQIDRIDLEGVEPHSVPAVRLEKLRRDDPEKSPLSGRILEASPDAVGGHFRVPGMGPGETPGTGGGEPSDREG